MTQLVSRSAAARMLVVGAFVVVSGTSPHLLASAAAAGSLEVTQGRPTAPGQQKRFRATRPIVPDKQTGQWRMPTTEEITEVVESLATLTNRPTEGLPAVAAGGNAVAIDLSGGFQGVFLARPNEDGTLETLCVFTFDEAADFLGLVEAIQ